MSKYSVVMHELADINLCLRNLDEAPQSTNQSHHANETVHPINTHPAPGSAECGSTGSVWHPTGQGLGLFAHSRVCVFHGSGGNHLQECGLCLTVITSLVFNRRESNSSPGSIEPPSCKAMMALRKRIRQPSHQLSLLFARAGRKPAPG